MTRDPADDFERTDLPEGSLGVNGDPIRPHVLYRMPATRWQARHA